MCGESASRSDHQQTIHTVVVRRSKFILMPGPVSVRLVQGGAMSETAIIVNLLALGGLALAWRKDSSKARAALRAGWKAFSEVLPAFIIVVALVSLIMPFLRPGDISRFIGTEAGFSGTLLVAVAGALVYIPSIVAFPLAATLLDRGASVQSVAAFISTLTMIGVVTLPLEIKELGRRMALWRNVLSAVAALAIAVALGALL